MPLHDSRKVTGESGICGLVRCRAPRRRIQGRFLTQDGASALQHLCVSITDAKIADRYLRH
jgi:hypothetical protein